MAEVLLFAVEVAEQKDENVNPRRAAIQILQQKLSEFAVAKDEFLEKLKLKHVPADATDIDFSVTYKTPPKSKVKSFQKYKRDV